MLAWARAAWLIENDLPEMSSVLKGSKVGKTASALLLTGLILFLSALGASPALHKLIHADADAKDHNCAITLFAKGQVSSAPLVQVLIGFILLFGGVALLAETFRFPITGYLFSSSRAPPTFV
jgi:hypothetical protein